MGFKNFDVDLLFIYRILMRNLSVY